MGKFIINARGAKIYEDITKHDFLTLENGESILLNILSIGNSLFKGELNFYLTTQRDDGGLHVYILPGEYRDWAIEVLEISKSIKLFPAQVEFSRREGHFCADIK